MIGIEVGWDNIPKERYGTVDLHNPRSVLLGEAGPVPFRRCFTSPNETR